MHDAIHAIAAPAFEISETLIRGDCVGTLPDGSAPALQERQMAADYWCGGLETLRKAAGRARVRRGGADGFRALANLHVAVARPMFR